MERTEQPLLLKNVVIENPAVSEGILISAQTKQHNIGNILANLSLHDYETIFIKNGYTNVEDLKAMIKETDQKRWNKLISVTELKTRHATRLKRRLQEMAKNKAKYNCERKTDTVMRWNEGQVNQWLREKSYATSLHLPWEYINGATLLGLTVELIQELKVPTLLIPQLLKDINALTNEPETLAETATHNAASLKEHLEQIEHLENSLSAMDYRARVNDLKGEWDGSLIKVAIVMALTYAVLSIYMLLIGVDRPFTGAIIPTMGFQLSTLPLPSIKACYVEHQMKGAQE